MDIDAIIAKHGVALPAVLPDGPGKPALTYTVGLFDRLPELLCVGPDHGVAGRTLNAVAAELRRDPSRARPGQRLALPTGDGAFPTVELGAMDACWHGLYVGRALAHHQRDDLEVRRRRRPAAGRPPPTVRGLRHHRVRRGIPRPDVRGAAAAGRTAAHRPASPVLVPRSLFHEQEEADLAVPHPDCPHCQTLR